MSIRFLTDGRLRLETGMSLDRGAEWLSRSDAEKACGTVDRVIYRWYPAAVDISRDPDRIAALVRRVEAEPSDVGARLYVGSALTVLTLEEFH